MPSINPNRAKSVSKAIASNNGDDTLLTDMSDTSEIDDVFDNQLSHRIQCSNSHEGRKVLDEDFNVHVDQLFNMLFTDSKFYAFLAATRKCTDVVQSSWKRDPETGLKCRKISFTLPLNHPLGPKSTYITETQTMLECSRSGQLYSINVTSRNEGVPYVDSFTVCVHYCLRKISDTVTNLQLTSSIVYKKNLISFVKIFIERNCYQAMEEFVKVVSKCIQTDLEGKRSSPKTKKRQRRTLDSMDTSTSLLNKQPSTPNKSTRDSSKISSCLAIFLVISICSLIIINGVLFWNLWILEKESQGILENIAFKFSHEISDPRKIPSAELMEKWSNILQSQSSSQMEELNHWRESIDAAITLLHRTETALSKMENFEPSVPIKRHIDL